MFGEVILQSPAFAIFFVPFRVVGGNLWLVRRHFTKDQLADWKNGQPHVAHYADVKLAPLDVFLGNGIAVVLLMNESHPFSKLLLILDERRLRNSVGRLFFHRLHQNRQFELLRPADALAARDDDKMRDMDSVIMQDFFRNAFVLAKSKTSRTAPGE